jgi:hypothetical protein
MHIRIESRVLHNHSVLMPMMMMKFLMEEHRSQQTVKAGGIKNIFFRIFVAL